MSGMDARYRLPYSSRLAHDTEGIGLHQKWTDLLQEIAQGLGVTLSCVCGQRGDFSGIDCLTPALQFIRGHLEHRITISRF